jgi:hypothetical protein
MQVSWIDPNEVRALLQRIAGPVSTPGSAAWETHTIPDGPEKKQPLPQPQATVLSEPPSPTPVVEIGTPEAPKEETPFQPAPAFQPAASTSEADTAAFQQAASIASDELERIRQRLRALRERAEQTGVLSSQQMADLPISKERAPELRFVQPISQPEAAPEQYRQPTDYLRPPHIPTADSLPASLPPPPVLAAPAVESITTELAPLSRKLERPTFQAPDRGLSDRLGALASWACVRLETQDVVLVDDFGDVLWGSPGHTELVLSGMMAWHSAQRANVTAAVEPDQRIDQVLPSGHHLTIIPARTRYGTLSLAAIRDSAVDEEDVEALRRALLMAVDGPG